MTSGGHKNVRNGLGIGLLGGAGVCALGYCALSAGLIPSPASPILVPIGIGIVVGSGILGAVAGEIFPKNNSFKITWLNSIWSYGSSLLVLLF